MVVRAGPYRLPVPGELDGEDAGGYPGFSLEYELVPGVLQALKARGLPGGWPLAIAGRRAPLARSSRGERLTSPPGYPAGYLVGKVS